LKSINTIVPYQNLIIERVEELLSFSHHKYKVFFYYLFCDVIRIITFVLSKAHHSNECFERKRIYEP